MSAMAKYKAVVERWKGAEYNEAEFISFLESVGYTEVEVRMSEKHLMYHMKEDGYDKTIVVFRKKNGKINGLFHSNNKLDRYEAWSKDATTGLLIAIPVLAIIVTIGWFAISGIIEVISNWDSEPSISDYDSDDKDFDGDVDYDDVEKHLNDSLEQDVNDGDD